MSRALSVPRLVPWDLPPPDALQRDPGFADALKGIYAYSDRPRSGQEKQLSRVRKLDRVRALLELMGSPQAHFATILVAGTKGKGSIAAQLASILQAAGHRVGRYTQPHLYSYCERTWAIGRYIKQDELVAILRDVQPALHAIEMRAPELGLLSTFDVGTALSLEHFVRCGVEIAVVEVGVGGAGDSTNVLDPILGLIGPVDIDHVETLGADLGAIAREKAGISRAGVDLLVAPQQEEATAGIRAVAGVVGARLYELAPESLRIDHDGCAGEFEIDGPGGRIGALSTPLAGRFQRQNAAMAVSAAQMLVRQGWTVSDEAIRAGLAGVRWPGRFQTAVSDPLTVVDGAHNPAAARALAAAIRECLGSRPVTLVLGMSVEKNAASTIAELGPYVERVIATRARHPRSRSADELAQLARSAGVEASVATTPGEAVRSAWAVQQPNGATVVAGSLFLVGDVLEWLSNEARG
ncbi:MAG: FolC bifunctional protein [Chloroflexi bacterium]|nr:FolC bifunctional protein [Chloroflexota bacterium]